jgi:hypothetical protein
MDRHTKLTKKNEPSSSSSMRPVTHVKARATIESNMKRMSLLNRACADMTLESKEEATDSESDDEEFQRRIGRSNAFIAYESSKNSLDSNSDDDASSDDEPIAFCLMAK